MMASQMPALEFPVDFVATANSELSVEERVEKMIEEKERRAMEAWTMMPRLFDTWDTDSSGTLDKNEVFMGVEEYCDAREIPFDSRTISSLWAQVDDNGDGVLDMHEFSVFLARYCEAVGIALDDMAMVVLSQLANSAKNKSSEQEEEEKEEKDSILSRLTFLGTRKPAKRASWAALKVESEEMSGRPQNSWEMMKLALSFKQGDRSTDEERRAASADNLWQKLDKSMGERKKRLENALSFDGVASKKVVIPADNRKTPQRRHTTKIEAKSLDGFFSSVEKVIDHGKRDRRTSKIMTGGSS